MTATPETVRSRLAELLHLPIERVAPATTLADLITDSLSVVETAIELQDEFDVILHHRDLRRITTVGDLTTLVAERAGATT